MDDHSFDVFREKFTPTTTYIVNSWDFGSLINFRLILYFAVFVLVYIAFLIILPGIREKRTVSFIAVTLQLLIGALLIGSLILPYWEVGGEKIEVHLQAHSKLRHQMELRLYVGLHYINITLKYIKTPNASLLESFQIPSLKVFKGLNLNERFDLRGVNEMAAELRQAYEDGLPYPVLKVLEYFSLSQGAFAWGHQFRNAGHYTNTMLWTAFGAWLLQGVFLSLVPHHFSKTGIFSGIFALISNALYIALAPSDLIIPFPAPGGSTTFLQLHYGSCFYMSILAGFLSIIFGLTLSLLQFFRLYTLTTFLNSNLDDDVGVKCRYGGKNNNTSSRWKGIECGVISAISSTFSSASLKSTTLDNNDDMSSSTGSGSCREVDKITRPAMATPLPNRICSRRVSFSSTTGPLSVSMRRGRISRIQSVRTIQKTTKSLDMLKRRRSMEYSKTEPGRDFELTLVRRPGEIHGDGICHEEESPSIRSSLSLYSLESHDWPTTDEMVIEVDDDDYNHPNRHKHERTKSPGESHHDPMNVSSNAPTTSESTVSSLCSSSLQRQENDSKSREFEK